MFAAKLDDKGRLKLPVEFQRYLASLPDKKFFVTSLDRRIALVYPDTLWRENEKFFQAYKVDPKKASRVAFTANELGADSDIDQQGRLQFSTELRRELKIENQTVRLQAYKGHIRVMGEAMYTKLRAEAEEKPEQDVSDLEQEGLV